MSACPAPGVLAVLACLSAAAGCEPSTDKTIEPADLLGQWSIVATGVTLTFEAGSAGQQYQLRDPQRAYDDLLDAASDLLNQGGWLVSRSTLFLEDDSGPVACPSTDDRFVITMNSAKTVMTLSHVGEECQQRALIMADYGWQRAVGDS
ncbi:MAG: hypothetical protein V3U35_01870 [Candidatus Neomarinimicrobiota bacterium]